MRFFSYTVVFKTYQVSYSTHVIHNTQDVHFAFFNEKNSQINTSTSPFTVVSVQVQSSPRVSCGLAGPNPCTRRSSYGLISTHPPDCPQSTCTTIAGSTGQKGVPLECFRPGRVQLAFFTKFLYCVLLVWLVYTAAMLVWYTAIRRPSILEMPKLIMVFLLYPYRHPLPS